MAKSEKQIRKTRSGLATLIWAMLAVTTASGAYIVARSGDGQESIASLVATARSTFDFERLSISNAKQNNEIDDRIDTVVQDMVRARSENDALRMRIAALEDAIGPITASVGTGSAPEETAALPEPAATTDSASEPATTTPARQMVALAPDITLAAQDESAVVSSTLFGLELASTLSLSDGKSIWENVLLRHPDVLGSLSPRISILETDGGNIELRLVAGPIRNAATVASLCGRLRAAGQRCNGTIYEGQTLALR